MPIGSSDIKIYKSSTGVGLGGAISGVEITSGSMNNLFDDVASSEATAGDTEYRCMYVKNDHGSITWQDVEVYISTNTTSVDTTFEIALGTSAISGTELTIADEEDTALALASHTFDTAAGIGNSLSIGDMAAGSWKAIWVKRIVSAGASALASDTGTISFTGDSAA